MLKILKKKRKLLPKVLQPPKRPSHIHASAKWLAGEGAGSWFVLLEEEKAIKVIRYSPKGEKECVEWMKKEDNFNLLLDFEITYPANCSIITVKQNGVLITLKLFKLD